MSDANAFDVLKERGFIKQATNEQAIREKFATEKITAYVGFDPTAESLHIGNLLCIMALAHLQRQGHRPIAIIGDGTGMIGDPSGKTEMRKMLPREVIAKNAEKIKAQIGRYFKIDGKAGLAVHNADWLLELNYVDFLRNIGRHFSVNRMLSAEAYKIRLETGLSFLEFNYQILQAYDFLKLYQDYNCTMQLGGDDQWGNILSGVDLVRRVEGAEVYCLTWPLLTTADGRKMGKTAEGAVWLDAEKTSPYKYYQFWINVDDRDVLKYLTYYTFLTMDEIRKLGNLEGADIRSAKQVLAYEATKITHGESAALQAQKASESAFGNTDEASLSGVPSFTVELKKMKEGVSVVNLFTESGLTSSKSDARRLIQQGGAYINQERVVGIEDRIYEDDFENGSLMLRAGKKRYLRILLEI
ncbi:MAG: tyrosine--tRNA ligase [bacterium]